MLAATIVLEVAESKAGPTLMDITGRPKAIVQTAVQVEHLEDITSTYLVVVACQAIMVVLQDIIDVERLQIAMVELQVMVIEVSTDHKLDFGINHLDQVT